MFNSSPMIDCCCMGAVPNLNLKPRTVSSTLSLLNVSKFKFAFEFPKPKTYTFTSNFEDSFPKTAFSAFLKSRPLNPKP